MAQRRGVGTIRTFGGMLDRRRSRTAHGAYVELASLALHRQRLLQEYKNAVTRNAEIEEQIRKMDRQAEAIQRLVDNPDEPLLDAIRGGDRAEVEREERVRRHDSALCEKEFKY